jgi:hypothetical protein
MQGCAHFAAIGSCAVRFLRQSNGKIVSIAVTQTPLPSNSVKTMWLLGCIYRVIVNLNITLQIILAAEGNSCLCSRSAADTTNICREWKTWVLASTDKSDKQLAPGTSVLLCHQPDVQEMHIKQHAMLVKPTLTECSTKS